MMSSRVSKATLRLGAGMRRRQAFALQLLGALLHVQLELVGNRVAIGCLGARGGWIHAVHDNPRISSAGARPSSTAVTAADTRRHADASAFRRFWPAGVMR